MATRTLSWGRFAQPVAALALSLTVTACGDPPIGPDPPPPPPPPVNTVPVITSITVQGTRPRQPANFADLGETVAVTAVVTDAETAPELLQYNWTATHGSFTGTGARVSWVAPAAVGTPVPVTITLQVVERFGTNLQNTATGTAPVALHDSVKEVGEMSRRFLINFSNTDNTNASVIMQDFGNAQTCPEPDEVTEERAQVIAHYTNFQMIDFTIGPATVSVNFGGTCPISGRLGDACAIVPARWKSRNRTTGEIGEVRGNDLIAASYSRNEARWRLCSSRYVGLTTLGSKRSFYIQ